jgi:hypothetical protein
VFAWLRRLRRLGTEAPPARERWQVERVELRSRDSYFESDSQYEFRVVDTIGDRTVLTFWRSEYANSAGSKDSGARQVTVDEDGEAVTVEYEDGRVERHPLPARESR